MLQQTCVRSIASCLTRKVLLKLPRIVHRPQLGVCRTATTHCEHFWAAYEQAQHTYTANTAVHCRHCLPKCRTGMCIGCTHRFANIIAQERSSGSQSCRHHGVQQQHLIQCSLSVFSKDRSRMRHTQGCQNSQPCP